MSLAICLAQDKHAYTSLGLAKNEATPIDLLTQLTRRYEDEVREEVAKNTMTTSNLLAQLARDRCISVRLSVAERNIMNFSVLTNS